MKKLTLRLINDNDLSLLKTWLYKDYILKWYHDPEEWLDEMKKRDGDFKFLNHFIILNDNAPVGFCQYYDCFYTKGDWYNATQPNDTFSIDYLIGEESYLGKGYGKTIVKLLTDTVRSNETLSKIVVQPEEENVSSCKVLLANDYIYDDSKKYYVKKLN